MLLASSTPQFHSHVVDVAYRYGPVSLDTIDFDGMIYIQRIDSLTDPAGPPASRSSLAQCPSRGPSLNPNLLKHPRKEIKAVIED